MTTTVITTAAFQHLFFTGLLLLSGVSLPCFALQQHQVFKTRLLLASLNDNGHKACEKSSLDNIMDKGSQTRRSMLAGALAFSTVMIGLPTVVPHCHAQQDAPEDDDFATRDRGGKPFAPRAALLPAARLKWTVDQMYDLSRTLASLPLNDHSKQYQILQQMNQLWTVDRPRLFQDATLPRRTINGNNPAMTAQITTSISSVNKQQYQLNRQIIDSVPNRISAMLNQADVERQWGMLQYQESKREQNNELRAALNAYTTRLEFGNAYILTAPVEERKRLIRNDALPSLAAVITADLDLRDLYRNEFLTAMEDVQAEINYQLSNHVVATGGQQNDSTLDVKDVVELMEQAHAALTKWFDLIAPEDVQEAMQVVRQERQDQQLYTKR